MRAVYFCLVELKFLGARCLVEPSSKTDVVSIDQRRFLAIEVAFGLNSAVKLHLHFRRLYSDLLKTVQEHSDASGGQRTSRDNLNLTS